MGIGSWCGFVTACVGALRDHRRAPEQFHVNPDPPRRPGEQPAVARRSTSNDPHGNEPGADAQPTQTSASSIQQPQHRRFRLSLRPELVADDRTSRPSSASVCSDTWAEVPRRRRRALRPAGTRETSGHGVRSPRRSMPCKPTATTVIQTSRGEPSASIRESASWTWWPISSATLRARERGHAPSIEVRDRIDTVVPQRLERRRRAIAGLDFPPSRAAAGATRRPWSRDHRPPEPGHSPQVIAGDLTNPLAMTVDPRPDPRRRRG
jgi:hypothetical protein